MTKVSTPLRPIKIVSQDEILWDFFFCILRVVELVARREAWAFGQGRKVPVAPVLRGPSREVRPTPRGFLLVRSKVGVI